MADGTQRGGGMAEQLSGRPREDGHTSAAAVEARSEPTWRFLEALRAKARPGRIFQKVRLGSDSLWGTGVSASDQIHYTIDVIDRTMISGWAIHRDGIKAIRALYHGVEVGRGQTGVARPDVGASFPDVKDSDRAGFRFRLAELPAGLTPTVTIVIEAADGTVTTTSRLIINVELKETPDQNRFRRGVDQPILSGFPFEVTRVLGEFRPGVYDLESPWDDALMERAVDDLLLLWQGKARCASVNRYLIFLKSMYHRFRWIHARFPVYNKSTDFDAKDWANTATSPEEMMAIANHLYVLKSHGLDGYFLEFGCFKGHSSCCLSHCCHELGISMEIFDSFAGLPPSDSTYYAAGEFAGSLTEVSNHLEEFGKLGVVGFNKGYFADSLQHFDKEPVLCIWMDVDLYSSAQDVAKILDRLPRASALFTHEFPSCGAQGGLILPESSEVLPPIVERFESLGRNPIGRHLSLMTGAIWDTEEGIPVQPHHCLMRLVGAGE